MATCFVQVGVDNEGVYSCNVEFPTQNIKSSSLASDETPTATLKVMKYLRDLDSIVFVTEGW